MMNKSLSISALATVVAILLGASQAHAAARTWVGNSSTDWTTNANWNGGTALATGDSITFGAAGSSGTTLTNTLTSSAFNVAGITFNAGDLAYTITGNTFNLTGGITNNSSNLQTFSNTGGLNTVNGLTFTPGAGGIAITTGYVNNNTNNTLTVTGAGNTLTLGGYNVDTSNSRIINIVNGTGNVNVTGNITGGDSVDGLTYSGSGTLTIGGGFAFNGNGSSLNVSSGVISLTSAQQGAPNNVTGSGSFNETSAGSILNNGGSFGGFTMSSTGTVTLAGSNTYQNATNVSNGTFNLSVAGTLSGGTAITVSGGAFNESGGAVISAGSTLTTTGGTTTLSGANTYTGATTVNSGTLNLDFSGATAPTTANNIIKTGNTINLGGGALVLKGGGSGATNTQTFGTTALTTLTSSTISTNLNSGTALTLALGAITRNAQSTVDLTFGAGTTVSSIATGGSGGLLGDTGNVAFATANSGSTWVAKTGSTPFSLAPLADGSYSTTYATGNNVEVTNGDSKSGVTVNTLRFKTASDTLSVAGVNIINAGGILVTSAGTGSSITGGGSITSSTAAAELVIQDYSSFNEGAIIANANAGATATKLTIAGTGTTTLSAANTITGQTALLGGTLKLANQLALQNSILQYNTGTTLVFDQAGGTAFTLGGLNSSVNILLQNSSAAAITLTVGGGNNSSSYSGVLSGTGGSLTKVGTGALTLGNVSTFTGATTVTGGSLVLNSSAGLANTSSVALGIGTTLSFARNANQSTVLGSAVVSGAGGIIENINNPNQAPTLDKANTYTGPTLLNIRGGLAAGVVSTYDGSGNQTSGAFGVNSAIQMTAGGPILVLNGKSNQVGSLSGSSGNVYLGNAILTTGGDNTSTSFGVIISDTYLGNNSGGSGAVSIGGQIVKIGTGTQTFTANNFYGGATTIAGGTLSISTIANGGAQTTGSTSGSSTTLTVASTAGIVVGETVLGSGISNASTTVTAIGSGSVTLSSTVTVPASSGLSFGFGNGIGTSSNAASNLVLDGGTLQYLGTTAGGTDRLFQIGLSTDAGVASGTIDSSSISSANTLSFTNTGALTYGKVDQADNLTLTGSNTGANTLAPSIGNNGTGAVSVTKTGLGTWALTATNTYSGGTTVNAGTLTSAVAGGFGAGNVTVNPTGISGTSADAATLNTTGSIASTALVTVNTNSATAIGTVNFNGATPTIGGLSGNGKAVLNNATGTALTVGSTNNLSSTFGGAISEGTAGMGSLVKAGTGTLTLNGADTYTGGTTISGGTLQTGSTSALGSTTAAVAVNNGATLDLDGNSQTIGALTLGTGGSNISDSAAAVTLTASSVTVSGTSNTIGAGATVSGGTTGVSFTGTGAALGISGTLTAGTGGITIGNGTSTAMFTLNSGGAIGLTAVSVGSGSSLALGTGIAGNATNLVGGVVTVAGGGNVNLQNGSIGTLTVGGLAVGNAGSPSALSFDIQTVTGTTSVDRIQDNGTLTLNGAGGTTITIGALGGTSSLVAGTYALIGYSGTLSGGLSNLHLVTTSLGGATLTLVQGTGEIDLNVNDSTSTTYNLAASAANARIMQNVGTTTVTSTITNTGTGLADTLSYNGLGATGASGATTSGGPLAQGASGSNPSQTFTAGATTGNQTITPTVTSATNGTLGGNATLGTTTTATVDVVANRVVTATSVALGRVLVGQAVSGTSLLSTTGADTNFTRVTVGAAGADANGISASGGTNPIYNSAGVTDTRTVGGTFSTTGSINGTLTLATTGEGLAGEAPNNVALAYTANPVNQRTFSVGTPTIALGRFLVTGTPVGSTAVSSMGLHNFTANATLGTFTGTNTSGLTLETTDPTQFNGAASSQMATYTIGGTDSTVGNLASASFSSNVMAELGSIAPVTVALTGDAVNQRMINNGAATNLGTLHNGATLSATSNAFSSTGLNATTTSVQVAGNPATGSPDANGIGLTGSATNFNGATSTQTDTRTLSGTITGSGTTTGSFSLGVTTLENGGAGLTGEGSYGNVTVAYTANVYSGQSVWVGNGTSGGSWGTLASGFGTNWGANQGSPGLDPNFTSTDTASFGDISGQTTQTVTLDGANPSLNSITFNGSNTSYTLAQGSGGSIALNGGAGSATVTDAATGVAQTQTINAPIVLTSNANVAVAMGQTLTLAGNITGAGGVATTGPGTTILSGTGSYTGSTSISAGTLAVTGSTLASGTVAVANGATLTGTGSTGAVTVAGGGAINLQDGAIGTLTVGGLATGNAGSPSALSFDIQTVTGTTSVDKIQDNGTLTLNGAGGTTITIGALGGTSSLVAGTYALIGYSGTLSGGLSNLHLATTSLGGATLTLVQGTGEIDLNVNDSTGTTYNLAASAANARIMQNVGTTTVTSTITNTGTGLADTLSYNGLGATPANGATTSGGSLAQGASGSNPSQTFTAGATTGNQTITPTVTSATNGTLGSSATLGTTTTATVDVVANRVVTATSVALGRVLVGQAVSGTSTLSTTGADANFTRVTVGAAGADANGISASGGTNSTYNGAGVTDTRTVGGTFSTAGNVNGTLTLATTGEGLAGEAPINVALGYTANPVNERTFTTSPGTITLGRFLVTTTPVGATTVSSSGVHLTTATATLGSFTATNTGGLTLGTTDPTQFDGSGSSQMANYTIGNTASAGLINGSFSSTPMDEFGNTLASVTVAVTGDAVNRRTISNGAVTDLGTLHNGTAVSASTNAFGSTGLNATTTSVQVAGNPAAGSPDANGIGLTGSATNFNGATSTQTDTRTLSGTITGAGTTTGSFNLGVTTLENGGAGLTGEGSYSPVAVAYTANVYSGQSVWVGNGGSGGSWGTLASGFGANWGANQGSPGLDPNFTSTDTATFGNIGPTTQTVTLDGANPSLKSITFNGSNTSYTLAQGTGGTIALNGGAGSATITDAATSGPQTISAPVSLTTSTVVSVASGQTLAFSGNVTGAGGLTNTGTGTLALEGVNTYLGATNINGGTVQVTGSTLASGTVAVANGATLTGTGSTGAVTVAGGGAINLQDGAIGTLTVGGLATGNAGSPSALSFDIQTVTGTTSVDKIQDNGTLTLNGAGGTTITIGALGGTSSLVAGTYALIGYSGTLSGGLSNLHLATTSLGGATLTLVQGTGEIDLNVNDSTGTTYNLAASAANARIMQNVGTTTVTSTITNTSSADTLNYSGLGATPANGATTSGGSLAQGASGSNPSQTFTAGATTGNQTITPTVTSATNGTLGGNATLGTTTTATVDVVANRVVTATSVALGRVLVGQAVSGTSTLSTTGADANFTRVTVGAAGADANGISASGGTNSTYNGAGVTDTRTVGGTFSTAGNVNGTLTLATTGEGLAGEAPINVALAYTADPVNQRTINVGAATNLGTLHNGATVSATANAFGSTGANAMTTSVLVAGGNAAVDGNGVTLTGSSTSFTGATSGMVNGSTQTFGGTITGAGTTTGSFNLGVTTLENGGAGLTGEGSYSPVAVAYTANVYSGQSVWVGNGGSGGSWGTLASGFGANWGANQGSPGLDPNFTSTDTATFGNIGPTTQTVTLDGANPSLKSITFNGSNTSYTLAQGTGGRLKLNNGGSTAALIESGGSNSIHAPIELDSNAAATVASTDTLTLSGPIGEAGGARSLTLDGPGTTLLAGANTYSGGTTLSTGALDVTGAGTLGATSGPLTISSGTLDLGNTIQTVGAIGITGAGTIQNGTLVGNSYTVSAASGIVTVKAVLAGSSALTKSGASILALNNANTYGGGTTISAGTVTVGSLTALGSGNVTLGGGQLQAGNGIHEINVAGNYTQTGGTLVLNLTGTNPGATPGYDFLHVTGTANLGGALLVNVSSPYVSNVGDTFTFLQAGAVTGGFSSVSTNLLSLSITPQGTGVIIGQVPIAAIPGVTYSPNQSAVAHYVDATFKSGKGGPGFQNLIAALDNVINSGNPQSITGALNQLSPEQFEDFARSTIINNAVFTTQLLDTYLAGLRSPKGDFRAGDGQLDSSGLAIIDPNMDSGLAELHSRLLAWSPAPLGHGLLSDTAEPVMAEIGLEEEKLTLSSQDAHPFHTFILGNVVLAQGFSQDDLAHSNATTGSVQVGADYRITPHFRAGLLIGFGHTDANLNVNGSKAEVDSSAPEAYLSYAQKGWYVNALASYGFDSFTEDRHIVFGGASAIAHGSPNSDQIVANVDGGYDFHMKKWTFGPTVGAQYTHLDVNSFTETGADVLDANLHVDRQQSESLRSRLGGHVSYCFKAGKAVLTPHLDASWQHEFLDQSRGITSQFASGGAGSFIANTPNPSRDSALIDGGLDADLNRQVTLFLDYTAQVGQSNYFGHSIQAGVKVGF